MREVERLFSCSHLLQSGVLRAALLQIDALFDEVWRGPLVQDPCKVANLDQRLCLPVVEGTENNWATMALAHNRLSGRLNPLTTRWGFESIATGMLWTDLIIIQI